MPDGFSVTLNGVEALNAKLNGLSQDLKYKGGRSALRKAAHIVRDAAVANASKVNDPRTAEEIAKNVTLRWSTKTFKATGDLAFRVGVLGGARTPPKRQRKSRGKNTLDELGEVAGKGKGNPGGDTFYWRFLEFGTEHAPAQPFLRRALSDNTQKAADTFITEYSKAIDRVLKRQAKGK